MYGEPCRGFGPVPGGLDDDGEVLRIKDAGPGHPATVEWLRYSPSSPWPIEGAGRGFSIELTGVAPDRDNDRGENWRASSVAGGTPGYVEELRPPGLPFFRRGDSNADGSLDISDARYTLSYLFLGGPQPTCKQSADTNSDEKVDLTDAIYGLNYLFMGGPPPPAPFEQCGVDPGGSLECASFTPCR